MSTNRFTTEKDRLRTAISEFSDDFASKLDDNGENQIFSPLGAWFLLAYLAGANPSAYDDEQRSKIEASLHMPLEEAVEHTRALFEDPAPAVAAAAKAWGQGRLLNEEWLTGLRNLGVHFANRVPEQEEIDQWAEENTFGLIKEFPTSVDANLILLLASTLATKVVWDTPFKEVKNESGKWTDRECLLLANPSTAYKDFYYDEEGNLYFVLSAYAEGLEVITVVPDDLETSKEATLSFATRFAAGLIPRALHVPASTLIDSASGLYTLKRSTGHNDLVTAIFPAWEAEQTIDLLEMDIPYRVAGTAVTDVENTLEVVQVAKASYTRDGFEAAALSYALFRATGAYTPNRETVEVQVCVDRPHAVVAKATRNGSWAHLPVFSAWVQK